MSKDPEDLVRRVCGRCFNDLSAPRKIVQLSQATRTWPHGHQQLFDAALQRGSHVFGDLKALQGVIRYQPFFPAHFQLSPQTLEDLHRWVLDTHTIPVNPTYRGPAASAIRRAKLDLYGPISRGDRYRLLLNRRTASPPASAADLLLDLVQKELPRLSYAPSSIQAIFFALQRFFIWLSDHHREVCFLRQIQAEHFMRYQIHQGLPRSSMCALRRAWRVFAPFADARGHSTIIGVIPWDDLAVEGRVAPIYADPLAIFQALDVLARDDHYPPQDRMLAHLLTLAAPSQDELCLAEISRYTPDGIRLVRRSLVASGSVRLPSTAGSRGRREDYRHMTSSTPFVALRSEPEYAALYEAVDAERQAILHGADCAFVFVTLRQRVCPEDPVSTNTIHRSLKRISSRMGASTLNLGVLRNSHAVIIAQHVSPRPSVIAAATGRSSTFATRLLRSTDLDPRSGLEPLPKIALVKHHGESSFG